MSRESNYRAEVKIFQFNNALNLDFFSLISMKIKCIKKCKKHKNKITEKEDKWIILTLLLRSSFENLDKMMKAEINKMSN